MCELLQRDKSQDMSTEQKAYCIINFWFFHSPQCVFLWSVKNKMSYVEKKRNNNNQGIAKWLWQHIVL